MPSHLLAKAAPSGREIVEVTPERAGWTHIGFRALRQKQPPAQTISPLGYHAGSTLVGIIEVMFATAGPVVLAVAKGSHQPPKVIVLEYMAG